MLWMLFFAVYSAIWPTFPIAPDMLGQASCSASLLVIHFNNVVIGVDVGPRPLCVLIANTWRL